MFTFLRTLLLKRSRPELEIRDFYLIILNLEFLIINFFISKKEKEYHLRRSSLYSISYWCMSSKKNGWDKSLFIRSLYFCHIYTFLSFLSQLLITKIRKQTPKFGKKQNSEYIFHDLECYLINIYFMIFRIIIILILYHLFRLINRLESLHVIQLKWQYKLHVT